VSAGLLPPLAEIKQQVARELLAERRRNLGEEFYRKLRAGYSVKVEAAPNVRVLQASGVPE
jgi:hypothetical protein